jgi:DNA-binding NtrC family response regulator
MKATILIVEDQFIEANNLKGILKEAGYAVLPIAHSVEDALEIIARHVPDLVLLDILLQGERTGIDLAQMLKERGIAFVFLSANSDKPMLDRAIATKPYGFLVKPFRERDVLVMLDVARYLHQQPTIVSEPAPVAGEFSGVIGSSPVFLETLKHVRVVGPSETSVLVLGESGSGKEMIARLIHEVSPRKMKPLVVVNCGALPPNLIEAELFGHEKGSFTGAMEKRIGKFEQADGGTIFLDEVGELPLDLQVKFLRVLQEREIEPVGGRKKKINVRIVAATNRVLEDEVAAGRFRIDLYYRLSVFPIQLPALRQRTEDILPLAMHFVRQFAARERKSITGLSDGVIDSLRDYSWPGNIRELANLMERCVLLCEGRVIHHAPLPAGGRRVEIADAGDPLKTITENERDHILSALERCNWKISGKGGAAELLAINSSTLYSRIKKLKIEKRVNMQ